jgi:hypothetical protein
LPPFSLDDEIVAKSLADEFAAAFDSFNLQTSLLYDKVSAVASIY